MVKEKGRLSGIGIFELGEQLPTLDIPATLCALYWFKHCFLASLEGSSGPLRFL
jgi:hypothetical protein